MKYRLEEFKEKCDRYFSKTEGLERTPTITGLATELGVLSRELFEMDKDHECYNYFELVIDKMATAREEKMNPDKWMNIVAKWKATENVQVESDNSFNILINGGSEHNLCD
jgi:DNA-directed RNA polymerase specialized sigma subunit